MIVAESSTVEVAGQQVGAASVDKLVREKADQLREKMEQQNRIPDKVDNCAKAIEDQLKIPTPAPLPDVIVRVPAGTGVKDVKEDEFWVRGHMPDYPLFPGVLMCEAAAQLCSYYLTTQNLMGGDFIGFGGLENVRFRGTVRIGDRLVLIAKGTRMHRRQVAAFVEAGHDDGQASLAALARRQPLCIHIARIHIAFRPGRHRALSLAVRVVLRFI